MTNTITYPAAYHVLSCDEMTYTEGGVGVVQAVMAWFPLYGCIRLFPPSTITARQTSTPTGWRTA